MRSLIMAETNTFCWNELNARDAAACKKFYGAVFGWTAHDQEFGPTTYTIFKKGDAQVAGMLQMTEEWGDVRPHWMPYIAVDDCDACAARIVENGGKVCVPPTDISVGRFAVVEDSNGGFFSIIRLNQ
jgi:predicted enzyme related to lactoylglutathione lyase